MKKTKIICTLGPATDNDQVLADMIKAGMDVARFNFSHGDYDAQSKRLEQLMRVREAQGVPVATLLDTKGPEIRTGDFEDPNGVVIHKGDTFTLTTKKCLGDAKHCYVNYPGLVEDVEVGTSILINDGLIAMEVTELRRDEIVCRVTDGGLLTNKKGVNVPDISLNMPYLSPADMQDLEFGASHDFDFIAASFVRTAGDVIYLRNFCQALGWNDVRIIAKIENMEGVNNIDAIIEEADGIMVARGDMGVEIPFERIPAIQKMIIRKVYSAGKVVVTATQMLESMITNARPTRAEITDVANAIYDGTSAIMLSGETAMGAHPVESMEMPIDEAKKLGAMMLFGEKYGNIVRVVKAGDFSTEFCGGTHVSNSGQIGLFHIVSEASVASGVRRITALTGSNVLAHIYQADGMLSGAAAILKSAVHDLPEKLAALADSDKAKDKEIKSLKEELAHLKSADLFAAPVDLDGLAFYTATLTDVAPDALRSMGDELKNKGDNVVAVVAGVNGEKANIVAVCGKEAIARGVKAGDVVREIAKLAGGGGGGRPDSAMAGCKNVDKLPDAMAQAAALVRDMIQ